MMMKLIPVLYIRVNYCSYSASYKTCLEVSLCHMIGVLNSESLKKLKIWHFLRLNSNSVSAVL